MKKSRKGTIRLISMFAIGFILFATGISIAIFFNGNLMIAGGLMMLGAAMCWKAE